MSASELNAKKHAYHKRMDEKAPRELKANIWEDVSVKIGNVHGKSKKITEKDFLSWKQVSVGLDSPSRMIETPHGCLILDDDFKNKIYLKGLLLPRKNERASFKFGYNFLKGIVNRDRERLANPKQEGKCLTKIWDYSICETDQETLGKYIEMLEDGDKWADVLLAGEYISERTALRIWQHYLDKDPERKSFYHDERRGAKVFIP